MNDKLKKVIFNYLLKDIQKVEIIYYRDSIWFINRENRYWYFEYHKVDKHLWWRWSHFTQGLNIFSIDAEKEQYIFGELVNMILKKKQKLESKYPNKVFNTIGSVMNFEDKDEDVSKNEIKTTNAYGWEPRAVVDEVLNCEVEKTTHRSVPNEVMLDEVLNCEVKTTKWKGSFHWLEVDEVLNCEVETTSEGHWPNQYTVDEALNNEVETTNPTDYAVEGVIEEALNYDIKTIEQDWYKSPQLIDDILDPKTTEGGELIDEDKLISDVLEIKNIFYGRGSEVYEIERALNSVSSAENGADHIMDFILTEGTERPQEEQKDSEILTQSPKLIEKQYDIDLVLDNTIQSIDGDLFSHDAIVDGILKKV